MIFQKRVDRAMKHTHEQSVKREENARPDVEPQDLMEKGDLTAMVLSGMMTILPVALAVLGLLALAGYLFLMR